MGERKRLRLCNLKKCPAGQPSFRHIQCSHFDTTFYKGQLHTWVPVVNDGESGRLPGTQARAAAPWPLGGAPCCACGISVLLAPGCPPCPSWRWVSWQPVTPYLLSFMASALGPPENPCELHCRPENESFAEKLRDAVVDGTPCYQGRARASRDLCINGICKVSRGDASLPASPPGRGSSASPAPNHILSRPWEGLILPRLQPTAALLVSTRPLGILPRPHLWVFQLCRRHLCWYRVTSQQSPSLLAPSGSGHTSYLCRCASAPWSPLLALGFAEGTSPHCGTCPPGHESPGGGWTSSWLDDPQARFPVK